jgi:hypothetical protein
MMDLPAVNLKESRLKHVVTPPARILEWILFESQSTSEYLDDCAKDITIQKAYPS